MIFGSGRGRDRALAGLLALVGLAAVVGPIYLGARADGAATRLSGQVPVIGRPEYAGSDRCAACHPGEYASWRRSYHRTMTQLATPDVALGPFDGRTLHAPDGPYRVETRGDELWVELVDPAWKLEHLEAPIDVDDPPVDAPRVWRRVLMTTGSHHMQVYWVAGETPRSLLSFPFAYLAEEGRWVPNESTLLRPPMEGVVYTWNAVCIKCHAVAGQPRLGEDGALDRVDTRAAELGIACESCHGPAAAHVSQYRDPFARYARHGEARPEEGVIDPARLDHEAASELCGQCHAITRLVDESRWFDEGVEFRPGARLSTALRLVRHPVREVQPWLDDELEESPEFFARRFWPDGMVRVSGREFNGLAESPCYQRGQLSCLTCHSMHGGDPDDQLAPIARTGDVCLRCHEAYAAAPARAAHTHHAPGSSGDDCYSCHMPHTSYGLLKAIRSHEVSSPSVEESARFRRPNACNLCHLDRSLTWTMGQLKTWYGIAAVDAEELDDDERALAASIVWALRGDAGQRALAAWHMGWAPALAAAGDDWQAPFLARLLNDPYAAVRRIAAASLRRLPGFDALEYDHVGAPGARAAAPAMVSDRWRALGTSRDDPALLLPGGALDLAGVGRLVADRDQREVTLAE